MHPSRIVFLAVLVAACAGGANDAGSESSSSTNEAAITTTSAPSAPVSTTSTASTSSTTPTTSTTTGAAASSDFAETNAPEASPTVALDSYAWDFATTIGAGGDSLLSVGSTGVYVDGSFDCEITAGLGGFEFTTRLVVVDDIAYFDAGDGEGLVEVDGTSTEVVESLGLCAGSDVFWADITGGEALPKGGESEERNGVESRRLDLTGLVDHAGTLGLFTPGVQGVTFDELNFWVADAGEWINSIAMSATLGADALEEITGSPASGDGEIRVDLDITQPNDESLSVAAP